MSRQDVQCLTDDMKVYVMNHILDAVCRSRLAEREMRNLLLHLKAVLNILSGG